MDREILFRGKRTDNGEWVEGYYARSGGSFILKDNGLTYGGFEMLEVVPETVCQYTGYTDLRKKKVFEHNIVFYEDRECCGHIVFKEGRFLIEWEEAWEDLKSDIHFWFENRRMHVAGNIFDNPELMEGGAE